MLEVLNLLFDKVHTPMAVLVVIAYGMEVNFDIKRENGKTNFTVNVSFRFRK